MEKPFSHGKAFHIFLVKSLLLLFPALQFAITDNTGFEQQECSSISNRNYRMIGKSD